MSMLAGWNGVLVAAAAASVLALLAQAAALRGLAIGDAWARRMSWTSVALAGAAFLWLLGRFIAADVSYEYVFLYTATDVPLAYRIAGTWTGREGSLLLWATLVAVAAAIIAHLDGRRSGADGQAAHEQSHRWDRAWMRLFLLLYAAAFLVTVARQGTFDATDPFFLQGRPDGNGINPTLRNPYILIHPPLMFVAYALTTIPLAAALAHLVTGSGRWAALGGTGARLDWMVYTFAMGLGGLWAYYTLGFGGYWAWDPVEVANFLPWLALTVFLHAQLRNERDGGLALIGPALAFLPFVLTVFSTVSTRSGLWVSVHAFTDPTNAFEPDAPARLLGIMDVDASLAPYFGLMLATLLGAGALWCRRTAIASGVLEQASRYIAAVLAALAAWAAVAPASLLAAWFEASTMVSGGRTGLGALALLVLVMLAAAAPLLWAPEQQGAEARPGRRRLTIPVLLATATLLLGLGLIIAILFHMQAVNGWDRAFWEDRVPWLATPIAVALMLLMLRGRGTQSAVAVTGGTVAIAVAGMLAFSNGLGVYALVMSMGLFVATMDRFTGLMTKAKGRARIGVVLLWVAALLDLVYWINPWPAPFGFAADPRWPIQVPGVGASLVALYAAHRVAAGQARGSWPYFLAGALGGFLVAPVLAFAAWWLHRGAPVDSRPWNWRALRPVGTYGVHLAVAVLFLGYSLSTYFDDDERAELMLDDQFTVGGDAYVFTGARMDPDPGTPWAQTIRPTFEPASGAGPGGAGILYWEPTTGSHYPLPHTIRHWDRDIYLSVEAVCINNCTEWVDAYERSPRIGWAEEIDGVRVQALALPGVSLVWTALALFTFYIIPIVMASARTRGRGSGQDLGKSP